MRLFHFYRVEDESGVSGTGPVVEGVQFTNGWCALRWISNKSSLCFYQSLDEVKAIHGHGGKTEIVVHDFDPLIKKANPQDNERLEVLMQIIEEASHITVLSEDSEHAKELRQTSLNRLKSLIGELEKPNSSNITKTA
jgi:galactose-1-phosphate uridylyltransferase